MRNMQGIVFLCRCAGASLAVNDLLHSTCHVVSMLSFLHGTGNNSYMLFAIGALPKLIDLLAYKYGTVVIIGRAL